MKKFVIGVLAVISVILEVQVIRELPANAGDSAAKAEYNATMAKVNTYNNACDQMDASGFQKIVKKQGINLDQVKQNLDNQINQGLDMTYNHVHSESDYNNLKKQLPKVVGDSFAKQLINNSMPTNTQNGLIYPNASLADSNISYGNYDMVAKTIPVEVTVHYKLNTGKGTIDGYGFYDGTYNVNKKELTNVQYTAMQSAQQQMNRNGGNN